ncbi:MAG: diaminopimelate epimerase [Rhodospirillaceae bacterium]
MTISFLKMHGLGNDFVVIDARSAPLALTAAAVRALCHRRTGVGCDQLIVIEPPVSAGTAAFMRIRNADGSEVAACGNATRCVAALLMAESGRERLIIETRAGQLAANATGDGRITVNMGLARLDWREIPLAVPADTYRLEIVQGPLANPVAVSMGNPHAVFFVPDAEAVALAEHGPLVEHHPLFPERTNVEVVAVLGPARLRMRVWERGTGITSACGTGACAALVAAARRGLTGRRAEVLLDGGSLEIEWQADGHVLMTGPVATAFTGTLAAERLGEA